MQEAGLNEHALFEWFEIPESDEQEQTFREMLTKKINTYYFDRKNDAVSVTNVSTLDAGSENTAVSEWGGLSSFYNHCLSAIPSIKASSLRFGPS